MPTLRQCEFFLLRYAPNPFADEGVNVGLVLRENALQESAQQDAPAFQDIRFAANWTRALRNASSDAEYLDALKVDLSEKFSSGGEPLAQVLKSMTDSWSNQIRVTDPRPVLTESPAKEMDDLAALYLDARVAGVARGASPRQRIRRQMQRAFEEAGVWKLLRKDIAVSSYTQDGDPLKIDCGYRPNGVIRMFHAVSLDSGREAKALAFSYPALAAAIAKAEQAKTELTAIIADGMDRADSTVAFSMRVLESSQIAVAPASQLSAIAQRAAAELRA